MTPTVGNGVAVCEGVETSVSAGVGAPGVGSAVDPGVVVAAPAIPGLDIGVADCAGMDVDVRLGCFGTDGVAAAVSLSAEESVFDVDVPDSPPHAAKKMIEAEMAESATVASRFTKERS